MWRLANADDDDAIVQMCLALNAEDPGPDPVPAEHTRRTLFAFRALPGRGRAVVLEVDGDAVGYALLVSFWSNELGGEVCVIDELFVESVFLGRGHGTQLISDLAAGSALWPQVAVGLALETTPSNAWARTLYERLGFGARNLTMRRRLKGRSESDVGVAAFETDGVG